MRLFKTEYKDKNGKKRQAKRWSIEIKDNLGIVRSFVGYDNEDLTKSLARRIERLVEYKRDNNSLLDEDIKR